MSKKTLLKGIIAVSAATTMLFSTAFAAEISSTRTLYVKGSTNTVEVATTVTGLTAGQEVTYLAGEPSNPVYINQYTANPDEHGNETFKYKTTRADFVGSTVKMAKANSDFTGGEAINVAAASTIPDATKFTFTLTDGTTTITKEVNPNEVDSSTIVAFEYTLPAGKLIDTLKVDGTEAYYDLGTGVITVTHGVTNVFGEGNTLNKTSAAIVITLKDAEQPVYEAPAYKSGYKVKEYSFTTTDPAQDNAVVTITGPMYAIFADSSKLPDNATEFGVTISANGTSWGGDNYPSKSSKKGEFAIAIVEADPENIPSVVYAKTYYKTPDPERNDVYVMHYSDDVITINVLK